MRVSIFPLTSTYGTGETAPIPMAGPVSPSLTMRL
jgi:hypothetical protein